MKISKVIGNNSVLARDEAGREVVLMGPGIGFKKKVNDIVPKGAAEKVYDLRDDKAAEHIRLLERVPAEYFDVSAEIIRQSEEKLELELSSQLVFSLTDHIYFAVERQRQGMAMPNLMLNEVRLLYPKEFKIGLAGRELIQERLGHALPKDEAGYIALHIVNAQMTNADVDINNVVVFTKGVLDIVGEVFGIHVDEDSFVYNRFASHLKFLAMRVFAGEHLILTGIEDMAPALLAKDDRLKPSMDRITAFVAQLFDYTLSLDEQVFLMIHIIKIAGVPDEG